MMEVIIYEQGKFVTYDSFELAGFAVVGAILYDKREEQ